MNVKESKERQKEHYVEVIRQKEPVRPSELGFKRIRDDWLKELVKEKRICKKEYGLTTERKKWHPYVLYVMPGHEYKADERFKRESYKKNYVVYSSEEKIKNRERHIAYLNTYIITPWLEQLPEKDALIFLWSEDIFPVEKDEMFQDFKKHIKSDYGNPFDELDIFKQVLRQFLSKKREIHGLTDDIFMETKKEYFDGKQGWFFNLSAIADFIIDRTLHNQNMDFRSVFINDFTSHVEEKNGQYFYYTMNFPKEMIVALYGDLEPSKKKFKEKMDRLVTKLLENTAKSERIQKEIAVLCELQEKLVEHIEKMRKSLKKHLDLGMLTNDCEYCL